MLLIKLLVKLRYALLACHAKVHNKVKSLKQDKIKSLSKEENIVVGKFISTGKRFDEHKESAIRKINSDKDVAL